MTATGHMLRFPGVADVALDAVAVYASPAHFHETYMAAVFSRPTTVRWGGEAHPVGPDRIALLNPREVHGGTDQSRVCPQDAFYPAPELLIDRFGDAEPCRFPLPVAEDAVLAGALCAAARAGDSDRLAAALVELFERHAEPAAPPGPAQAIWPADLPEAFEAPVADWARAAGCSPSHFSRRVRALSGLSPTDLRRQQRVYAARDLIEAGAALGEAAAEAGFADQAHMTRQFRAILGVTPGELRRKAAVKR
jgi:AraC-like DNA-binding protein